VVGVALVADCMVFASQVIGSREVLLEDVD
jgi:hypothetical protein